jgi:hypothetical protein
MLVGLTSCNRNPEDESIAIINKWKDNIEREYWNGKGVDIKTFDNNESDYNQYIYAIRSDPKNLAKSLLDFIDKNNLSESDTDDIIRVYYLITPSLSGIPSNTIITKRYPIEVCLGYSLARFKFIQSRLNIKSLIEIANLYLNEQHPNTGLSQDMESIFYYKFKDSNKVAKADYQTETMNLVSLYENNQLIYKEDDTSFRLRHKKSQSPIFEQSK